MRTEQKKQPKMRKLSAAEVGSFRAEMMSVLSRSPDPFGAAQYIVDAEPGLQFMQAVSEKTGTKITRAHVLNKLLGAAVAENPVYNQIILGSTLYQMEDIHIANAVLLPGREQALTYILLENPHRKSLPEIQQEALMKMVAATKARARPGSAAAARLMSLYFRAGLNRLVSEKLSFRTGFRNGLLSNIVLSNHEYMGGANFTVLKPVITPVKIPLRVHSYGAVMQTVVEHNAPTARMVFPLTVIADHRILHGIHGYRFGESLQRIAADPEKHLS